MDPLYSRFLEQRGRAKQRGIAWQLAFWEWLQIWEDSGHLHERGWRGGEWVMGRKGDCAPYASGNVRIIRVATNNRTPIVALSASGEPYGYRVAVCDISATFYWKE
jgi:hypothetical protein